MGNLADYNINELAGSAALIISSIGGLLLICFKSRCTNVKLCWGCYDCERAVPLEDKKDGTSPTTTPTTTPTPTPTASSTVPSLSITNP